MPKGKAVDGGLGLLRYNRHMRVVLKSNDAVLLSYAADVLSQEGIESLVFDTHASIMDGSMGMVPRRLMVGDDDFSKAERLLKAAVPDAMP